MSLILIRVDIIKQTWSEFVQRTMSTNNHQHYVLKSILITNIASSDVDFDSKRLRTSIGRSCAAEAAQERRQGPRTPSNCREFRRSPDNPRLRRKSIVL